MALITCKAIRYIQAIVAFIPENFWSRWKKLGKRLRVNNKMDQKLCHLKNSKDGENLREDNNEIH